MATRRHLLITVSLLLILSYKAAPALAQTGTPIPDSVRPQGLMAVLPYILLTAGSLIIGFGVWYYLKPEGQAKSRERKNSRK